MPSLPFFKKKEESSSSEAPPSEPATDAPAVTAEPAAEPAAAVDETPAASEASASAAPAVEKTVIEPKRGFFSRKKSTDGGAASESESEGPANTHSRLPSFLSRKAKPTPTVKEEDKENVPETVPAAEAPPAAAETEAPTTPVVEEKKDGGDKVRRRISLFQRRNRVDGATSEPEGTDGEKDAAVKAKRTSFWKSAAPPVVEEPVPEDPRLTEAKAKVTEASEAEHAARAALEAAKQALLEAGKNARQAKAAVRTVEAELAAEAKKARATVKKDERKSDEPVAAAPATAEPPVVPQVTAAA